MIEIKNVTVAYQTQTNQSIFVLDDVSTTVETGQWVSIIGPSGSGKTSFLKLIGGLLVPAKGTVVIDEKNIYQMKENQKKSFRHTKVSFVYQQFRLLPQFSVLENVMLPLIPYNKRSLIQKKAIQIIEKIGLSHRMNHLPSELSGVEQQRVAIARALITDPEILLCDEPTGNLDFVNRDNLLMLLEEIHQEGHTIILATHDEVVANKGQRIIEIADGTLREKELHHD